MKTDRAVTITASTNVDPEVTRYVHEVALRLSRQRRLSPTDRQDLLDDLARHLGEVRAEEGETLTARLGPPEDYARELLASAGYDEPAPKASLVGVVWGRCADPGDQHHDDQHCADHWRAHDDRHHHDNSGRDHHGRPGGERADNRCTRARHALKP